MQNKFILFFSNSTLDSSGDIIHKIYDISLIKELEKEGFFNNLPPQYQVGERIILNLNALTLKRHFIYKNLNSFIINHTYSLPAKNSYILDLKTFIDKTPLYETYTNILRITDFLKDIFTHDISENSDEEYIGLLIKENKSLIISLTYNLKLIEKISISNELVDKLVNGMSSENESERKSLFLNELIVFFDDIDLDNRFEYFLIHLSAFISKAEQSYEYYLRDFSYNKLKIEIDTKLLDFSQKLQAVINDSQTKLIAIPAGFILVLTALDFQNILSAKNIITMIGLLIFVLFLNIFVDNQKSSLTFIMINLQAYKKTFEGKASIDISKIFEPIENEFIAQKKRIYFIEALIWFIPTAAITVVSAITQNDNYSYIMLAVYALLCYLLYFYRFSLSNKK
jgi:hypothetical protein